MPGESENGALSELSLGFRELFRIVIPGAYSVLLVKWLGAGDLIQNLGEARALTLIALSILAGLIAYGLQVHEKWFPYNVVFEASRSHLNDAIVKVAGASNGTKDHRNEYKYFLETRAGEVKDRIHYFSSFFYMLDEMSLISAIAAIALIFNFFRILNSDWPVLTNFVVIALILQLLTLYPELPSWTSRQFHNLQTMTSVGRILRAARTFVVRINWFYIVLVWVSVNIGAAIYLHRLWPRGPRFSIDWRVWALICVAVIFERLGAKQWQAIIREQVVLVRDKRAEVERIIGANADT